jgi:hypothetical protein
VKASPISPATPAWPAALLGCLLGLAILKFGNPVILEQQIGSPESFTDWLSQPWPPRIGRLLLALIGASWLLVPNALRALLPGRIPRWIWWAPVLWFAWQCVSAASSTDPNLTAATLPHLGSLVALFFLGIVGGRLRPLPLLLGVGAASAFCWLQAVNQHLIEFPRDRDVLLAGQQSGWTNFTPTELDSLRANGLIVRTNGTDIPHPVILDKLTRGRVHGTLVYPNALAGLVLLTTPVLIAVLAQSRSRLRPALFLLASALLVLLAAASLWWSGSRSGWLIAVATFALFMSIHPRFQRVRLPALAGIVLLGFSLFLVRNSGYFRKGATSVSARLDYWEAAVQNALDHPIVGSGPGTFMRPYARLKRPESEMARLTHNDYLQQFTDAGFPSGIAFSVWIGGALLLGWSRLRSSLDPIVWGVLLGTSAWFVQAFSEFGLYVPALGWIAMTFLGWLCASSEEFASTAAPTASKTSPTP